MAPRRLLARGKGPVELDARVPGLAGEVDPGKVLAGGDLKIGEGLVVLEVVVVLGLDVLDQPGFHQQRIDLAVGHEVVDVGDLVDPVADPPVLGRGLVEVRAGPGAQVLGLADVDHPRLGVLHEVEARRGGQGLDLLGRCEQLAGAGVPTWRPRGIRPVVMLRIRSRSAEASRRDHNPC